MINSHSTAFPSYFFGGHHTRYLQSGQKGNFGFSLWFGAIVWWSKAEDKSIGIGEIFYFSFLVFVQRYDSRAFIELNCAFEQKLWSCVPFMKKTFRLWLCVCVKSNGILIMEKTTDLSMSAEKKVSNCRSIRFSKLKMTRNSFSNKKKITKIANWPHEQLSLRIELIHYFLWFMVVVAFDYSTL